MTTVVVRLGAGYTCEVEARGHRWVADEVVEKGGSNLGPNPYELLQSAYGA